MVMLSFTAPIALASHGIAKGKKVTSHPAVDKTMKDAGCSSFYAELKL